MFEVVEEVMEFGPVVSVGVFYTCQEEGKGRVDVVMGAHDKEEDLGDGAVEDLCLLFVEGSVCVVVAYSEEVFARWGFCGFTKVYREFFGFGSCSGASGLRHLAPR